ncbi:hypothetical protein V474_21065 [Novosphingobium barchaimii LL02]|uniref:Uncharacterized protein n=1 Tax=Novosphingobium barchaimii LL02 TaxID=1114963 RepID=A0A0J7XQP7_9SPHN|nr:hypothetical protein [Novosphingobium barchaimii]KMS54231.1 hypothetical protein V474_21065 [Novosphingobium barchaimii LL02]
MTRMMDERGAWFAPRRYGYGAGLPIAWQGWLVIACYVAALAGIGMLHGMGNPAGRAAAFALFLLATGLFAVVAAKHTRGGWKWRWGERD